MSNANQGQAVERPSGDLPRLAVGVDLVAVDDVQAALANFGDRYLSRVFTDHEVACSSGEVAVRALTSLLVSRRRRRR